MTFNSKSKDNPIIQTIFDSVRQGVGQGVLHLTSKNESYDGRTTKINNQTLLNFSSYSYLGLENHSTLKNACIDAVNKYGTQYGYSRAFISLDLYDELEDNLERVFNSHVVVAPSTTLAHQAVMPVMIGDKDVIIIDQQAHASMYYSVKSLKDRGVRVELVRHNRIDLIEDKILSLRHNYKKIWYVCDGVYSMFGDYAPILEINELMNKYEQFHAYIDDAHGMSWTGLHGRGYALSQIDLHPQMILITSLNKAFGAAGGVIVLPNEEWKMKIRACGGTLMFSTPIQPPMLGVGVASSELHLSNEIIELQKILEKKIRFCSEKIEYFNIPEMSKSNSPIFYLPTSYPKVSYNLAKRMMNNGFYVTPTIFPAVSMRKSGIRFCINVNNTNNEINEMLNCLTINYSKAIEEEGVQLNSIFKSFNIKNNDTKKQNIAPTINKPKLLVYNSIKEIEKQVWNMLLGDNGTFDWDNLVMFENTFRNNEKKENNWTFYYYMIYDVNHEPILATFFTKCWCKDDMFKNPNISKKIEQIREDNKYYLCAEVLMMGTMITEGQHLYLNKKKSKWKQALLVLLEEINLLQSKTGVNAVYLRDFGVYENEVTDLMLDNGFIKTDLPDYTHILNCEGWNNMEEHCNLLNKKKRRHLRQNVLNYEEKYIVNVLSNVDLIDLKHFYELYISVQKRSIILNTFTLPFTIFESINSNDNWEIIILSLKEQKNRVENKAIAVVFSYKTKNIYTPMLIGFNSDYLHSHKNYKQAIYQVVKRATKLGVKKIHFGITASLEKRRVGAKAIPKKVFVQINDTYNFDILQLESAKEIVLA